MSDTLIKVEGVSKKFCRSLKKSLWYGVQDIGNEIRGRRHGGNGQLRPDEFWAVKDVGFELRRGECLGLIGRNGAGKTTLLRMLNGLIKPDAGRIEMQGRVGALIALGAGFNPILTAGLLNSMWFCVGRVRASARNPPMLLDCGGGGLRYANPPYPSDQQNLTALPLGGGV